MSAFHVSTYLDKIADKEKEQNSNILVGSIDSFTDGNYEIFQKKDMFGNPPVDYVQGKYASLAGPAFAMIYNAITGNPDAVKRTDRQHVCTRASGLQQMRKIMKSFMDMQQVSMKMRIAVMIFRA